MRKQPERGFYVKDGAIVHAKVCPDGAREIMPAEAQAIRSARPKPVLLLARAG